MGILSGLLEQRATKITAGKLANPPTWLREFFGGSLGGSTAAGISISEETAMQYVAVFACVRILAETMASLPLPTYRRLKPRGRERAVDHPLYSLLHDQPNPEQTSFQWRETKQAHLALWGNAYSEIQFGPAGWPVALWPLTPSRVKVERKTPGGPLRYRVQLPGGGEQILFPEQVLHIAGLSLNGLTGLSPIGLAREAIGLGMAAEEFGSRFFSGGARPGAVLEHPGSLSPTARENIRESWEGRHKGLQAAHRIAVLEEGMKLHEVGIPPEDAQYLEVRKHQIAEIARIFRIPLNLLDETDKAATYASVEQFAIQFVVHTIRPWCVRWEQALRKLFPPGERGEYFAEFLIDGLLRGDMESRFRAYGTGRQWGWYSANDILEMENRNPIDGGDTYLVPLNMLPAGTGSSLRSLERRSQASARGRLRLRGRYHGLFGAAAGKIVRREAAAVRRAVGKYLGQRGRVELQQWLRDFYGDLGGDIERELLPVLESYAQAVAAEVADEMGVTQAEVDAFVRDYLAAYVQRHTGSSQGQLLALIQDTPPTELAEALEQRLGEWEETRPTKIANDEVVRAGSAVARLALGAAGVTTITWIAQGSHPCPYCEELNGRVVGIEMPFFSGGEDFKPGGVEEGMKVDGPRFHPPLHLGCECDLSG